MKFRGDDELLAMQVVEQGTAAEVLRAPKACDNNGSKKISHRSGMRLVGVEKKQFISGLLDAELWEITKAEWNALAAQAPASYRETGC